MYKSRTRLLLATSLCLSVVQALAAPPVVKPTAPPPAPMPSAAPKGYFPVPANGGAGPGAGAAVRPPVPVRDSVPGGEKYCCTGGCWVCSGPKPPAAPKQ